MYIHAFPRLSSVFPRCTFSSESALASQPIVHRHLVVIRKILRWHRFSLPWQIWLDTKFAQICMIAVEIQFCSGNHWFTLS